MRYALAVMLAVAFGVAGAAQAPFAGRQERPRTPVSAVTAQYGPGDPGMVAAPMTPWSQIPAVEHDRN
ncbi:MAG TPA: hypothetical protein VKW09_02385 [bacterium]|nr:hypothetical protein [bacterium]